MTLYNLLTGDIDVGFRYGPEVHDLDLLRVDCCAFICFAYISTTEGHDLDLQRDDCCAFICLGYISTFVLCQIHSFAWLTVGVGDRSTSSW